MFVHDKVFTVAERFRFAGRAAGDLDDHRQQGFTRLRQGQLAGEDATGVKVHVVDHTVVSAAVARDFDQG